MKRRPSQAARLRVMTDALETIARYPFPVFTVERDGQPQQYVPVDNVVYLQEIAENALKGEAP